ncbi:hypothetical conserved protein [Candidatus Nitrosoglobus terrae]|uniref:protein O-GlcNAc transferase n=1 Tax=Candidatus Nitrosoglobus terrae TaxID=1630141 RepID=A0A1Q2SK54_9GAMM|nr:tetratricopeptide repeat protein [Candidatus Nitrosoglobus terrae]BAW79525.1 hypothetical conserved protein [Candidatus Nitrosoglobus terrae]
MNIEEIILQARKLQMHRHLYQSAQLYQQILDNYPNHPEALLGLGNIAIQNKDFTAAIAHLERLLTVITPQAPLLNALSMAHNNQGSRLFEVADLSPAITHFQRAVALNPNNKLAWRNLTLSQLQLGLSQAAVISARQTAALDPHNQEAQLLLARSLITDNQPLAAIDLLHSLSNIPLSNETLIAVAEQWLRCHQSHQAWALLQQQCTHLNTLTPHIMTLARRYGENWQAAQWLQQRLRQEPNVSEKQYLDLAQAFAHAGESHQAMSLYQQALAVNPNSWQAKLGSMLTLPIIYDNHQQLTVARNRFTDGLNALKTWQPKYLPQLADLVWSNFFLAYQGFNDLQLQTEYGNWLHQWASHAQDTPYQVQHTCAATLRRIGFVSSFFRDCTVGHYFGHWPETLRKAGFEVIVYQLSTKGDHYTHTIASSTSKFYYLTGNLSQCAAKILEDKLDGLIYPELGMDAQVLVLAALRLAPLQCCAWGHPITSGLPTIDIYFSCGTMEPNIAQDHYREQLILLPGIGTSYPAPLTPPAANRQDLGLPENRTLYLLPQSPFKIHPDMDTLLAQILAEDSMGTLVLFMGQDRRVTDRLWKRLEAALANTGANPKMQMLLLPVTSRTRYLQINRCCNLMLDPPHWSGGNTALDALSSGLPIISLPSGYMRGRQTAAMLTLLELPELIAHNTQDYVAKALYYGGDKLENQRLRNYISARCGRLFNQQAPLEALIDFFQSFKG